MLLGDDGMQNRPAPFLCTAAHDESQGGHGSPRATGCITCEVRSTDAWVDHVDSHAGLVHWVFGRELTNGVDLYQLRDRVPNLQRTQVSSRFIQLLKQ